MARVIEPNRPLFVLIRTATFLAISLLHLASPAAPIEQPGSLASLSNESSAQHDTRMQWWREARFGMFIHWGLYSQAAGEWKDKASAGAGEWIMNDLQIPLSEYKTLAPKFNPTNFDAREWVRLAREAGMKYVVVTTKHHDGFSLYPSSFTDWTIKATPFRRDPIKELSQACQEQGLHLGLYYSIMDWSHPDYAPRKSWNDLAKSATDFERYVTFMKSQLDELFAHYRPVSVLWLDGEWENTWTYEHGADLYAWLRALQPELIVNNRVSTEIPLQPGQRAFGDFKTPEQTIPATGMATDWESCMTINNTWGYKQNDHDWKPAQTLIRSLIDCASKGGNYLLNVGPKADGSFPEETIDRLKQIGRWVSINGEAIYGTTSSPFKRPLPWGRCTMKTAADSTILYLHVFDWPSEGELLLPGLQNPCKAAWLLADVQKHPLLAEMTDAGLAITLPKNVPAICLTPGKTNAASSTIAVVVKGAPHLQPIKLSQRRDGSITLPSSEARLHGTTLQYESDGVLDNIGYWSTPEDWADWEFNVDRPGRFAIAAVIAAPASGSFEVSVAGQTLHCTAPKTGNYITFLPVKLGEIEIASQGKAILSVRPIKDGWQPMNLKTIRLQPVRSQNS